MRRRGPPAGAPGSSRKPYDRYGRQDGKSARPHNSPGTTAQAARRSSLIHDVFTGFIESSTYTIQTNGTSQGRLLRTTSPTPGLANALGSGSQRPQILNKSFVVGQVGSSGLRRRGSRRPPDAKIRDP